MFRLLGFLVGSLAAIVVLFTLIGTPKFQLSSENDDDRFRVAVQQLKNKQQMPALAEAAPEQELVTPTGAGEQTAAAAAVSAAAAVDTLMDSNPARDNPLPETNATATTAPDSPMGADRVSGNSSDTVEAANNPAPSELSTPVVTAADSEELVWQPFWNPFRSELAAQGFVRRLESVTGLDYRVERVKNGVYEVAFSYYSDAERDANLTQIAAATGLDLSDALR